ncbi:MAG: hypothetical protein QXT28_06245 [Thermofilaceae archaeon]
METKIIQREREIAEPFALAIEVIDEKGWLATVRYVFTSDFYHSVKVFQHRERGYYDLIIPSEAWRFVRYDAAREIDDVINSRSSLKGLIFKLVANTDALTYLAKEILTELKKEHPTIFE